MILKRLFCCALLLVFAVPQMAIAQDSIPANFSNPIIEKLIQPPYLKAGDTVAIVAPSGILLNREKEVNQAVDLLKSWNLNVIVGEYVFSQNGHFAGTDVERAADFQKALDNPNIKVIWCARGGYGAVRILDKLDYSKFKTSPKWVIGYSDITALHNQIHNQSVESIHALMCTSLTKDLDEIKDNVSSFKNVIFGNPLTYTIASSGYNKPGSTSGQLVGGNLTLLHTMLGSTTSIDTNNKIIFIEEVGEYAYHIDRMLQSLKRAGYFDNCKGLIVGTINRVRKNTTDWGTTMEQLILDVVKDYDFPVLFDFPAGHADDNRAMIFGRAIQLAVGSEQSSVVFEN